MTVEMASEPEAEEDANECPACGHSVYQAEALLAANRRWHKRCFKCLGCQHLLSSVTCNVFKGNLLCKHCLRQVQRPNSPMMYPDTTSVSTEDTTKCCPRCNGAVFQAEEVVEKGISYHKRCFTCCNCNRPQTDKLQVFVGFDTQLYCKTCYPKIWHTPLPLDSSRNKIKAEPGDESGCPRCGGKVFEAEKMASKTGWYHKLCFTCKICNRLMDYSNYVDYESDVFCKSCFCQHFDNHSYHLNETKAIQGQEGEYETCPKCGGIVYEAEKVVSRNSLYHRSCLACQQCAKKLSPSNFFDASDGHVYCRQCYSVNFGSRGRAKSVGPVDSSKCSDEYSCRRCQGRVYEAEKMTAKCGWFHRGCFKCFSCNKIMDASNYQDGLKDGVFCNGCHKMMLEEITTKNSQYAKAVTSTSIIKGTDTSQCCPRCYGVVFDAEKMAMRSGNYHKKCFTCSACKRNLDYLLAVDGPNAQDVFCQSCYIKHFGPTEIKYNLVSDPTNLKMDQNGDHPGCKRCGGAVFHAEQIWAKNNAFHKTACSTCFVCNKRLDSLSLNSGPDGEIYCKSCHENHFGSHKGQPSSYNDVRQIKAATEDEFAEKCIRCHGKVFDMEKIVAGKSQLIFHKSCLTCTECKRSLNQNSSHASKIYAFEPPLEFAANAELQGSIFCQKCHMEKFQDANAKPCTWYDSSAIKDEDKGCPRCGGAVYQAEEIVEKGISFHKKCFTCKKCTRPLNDKLQVFNGFDHEIYCKVCYPSITHTPLPMDPRSRMKSEDDHRNTAQSGGKNFYLDPTSIKALKAEDNDENACVKCRNKVFENEKVSARSGLFHKSCLTCFDCCKILDVSTYNDGRDGGIYCKNCYNTKYGARGRSASVKRDNIVFLAQDGDTKCPNCQGKVFDAEKCITPFGTFHPSCFKCWTCSKTMTSTTAFRSNNMIVCKQCLTPDHQEFEAIAKALNDTEVIKTMDNDPDKCPRCSGKVFDAEKMSMKVGNYHKKCFACVSCLRKLDFSTACDGVDDIYCNNCYFKTFGPVGVKYQVPTETGKIRPENEDLACPRCLGAVYEMEKVQVKDKMFHKNCCTCKSCNRLLDTASDIFSLKLQDKYIEIFCQGCYSRFTGVAGFRGNSSLWVDEKCADVSRPQVVDTSAMKSTDPNIACRKCQGVVYDLEKTFGKDALYHKSCFKCDTCVKRLDTLNSTYIETDTSGIHCTRCFDENFGCQTVPQMYPETSKIKGETEMDTCPKCKGKVFEAEKIMSSRFSFHKNCFKCTACNLTLDVSSVQEDGVNGSIYCKNCYTNKNFLSGKNSFMAYIGNSKSGTTKIEVDANSCLRCNGKAFEAEKVQVRVGVYHTYCLKCHECQKQLETTNFLEATKDKNIYCAGCYATKYGVRSRAASLGPLDYQSIKSSDASKRCMQCSGQVFEAEEKLVTPYGLYHRACFRCVDCNLALETSIDRAQKYDQKLYCRQCCDRAKALARESGMDLDHSNALARSFIQSGVIQALENDPDQCPRCKGKVFTAELVAMKSGHFHKRCFTCCNCKRALDMSNACDGPNGDVFCSNCYGKYFGAMKRWFEEDKSYNTVIQSVDGQGCPRCNGIVYEAEKVVATETLIYHKKCASCNSCHIKLDSASLCNGPDREIYCQNCHARKFGGAGLRGSTWVDESATSQLRYSQSIDPSKLKITNDPDSCRKCQGKVYDLEKIAMKSGVWHRQCFNCSSCNYSMTNTLDDVFDRQGSIYCRPCLKKHFVEESQLKASAPKSMIQDANDPNACPRCQCKVFEAEKMMSKSKLYHKQCFTCCQCDHTLDYANCMEGPNNEIYCKTCYVKEYFAGGRNKFGDTKGPEAAQGDPDTCPKCLKKVYDIEKVQTSTHCYHKGCLRCSSCSRSLEATNYFDAKEDGLFCYNCYEAKFGVKGHPGALAQDLKKIVQGDLSHLDRCQRCGGNVYEAEKMVASIGFYHPGCFKCAKCSRSLDHGSAFVGDVEEVEKDIYCSKCYNEEFAWAKRSRSRSRMESVPPMDQDVSVEIIELPNEDILAQSMVETTRIMADDGDANKCPKCNGKVFEAERMASNKNVFHRKCFTCNDCHRALDASLVNDGPGEDGMIFCTNCYQKHFGPTVRLESEFQFRGSLNELNDPSLKGCHRCKKVVYIAEEIVTNGRSYHKSCSKCYKCSRQLDLQTLQDAPDEEIYCFGCYGRLFGSSGYRGTSSNVWTNEEASKSLVVKQKESTPLRGVPATIDVNTDSCIRCSKPVYEAEKMVSKFGLFHQKGCYNCFDCHINLDPSKACELGDTREVYCKNCYNARRGLAGYGYGSVISTTCSSKQEVKQEYHFTQFF